MTAFAPSIDTRFAYVEALVDMVIAGRSKSLIVCGDGGLGKTFTVTSRLRAASLVTEHESNKASLVNGVMVIEYDYESVKGFTTPKALYRALHRNRERLVLFDDCDSVWKDATSVSILKAALDSYDERWVTWLSEARQDDLPATFRFDGRIIFISNLSLAQLDQAVLSRALYVDVTMTAEEKIERIRTLAPKIRPEVALSVKQEALEVLAQYAETAGDLNLRTFLKVLDIRLAGRADWRELARYVITAIERKES